MIITTIIIIIIYIFIITVIIFTTITILLFSLTNKLLKKQNLRHTDSSPRANFKNILFFVQREH